MCTLCAIMAEADHWSDFRAAASPSHHRHVSLEDHLARRGERLRDRARRARLASLILRPWRISVSDWEGGMYLLRTLTGKHGIAPNLQSLWVVAEELAGVPIDPLEPGYLAFLTSDAPSS
uniref:Uncharacterized protein n=1 Tax=Thermorudis peleae TaxID=1382356 RepID=A0A831TFF6_9BACT